MFEMSIFLATVLTCTHPLVMGDYNNFANPDQRARVTKVMPDTATPPVMVKKLHAWECATNSEVCSFRT